jgi:glutamate dehydrogenase (NAD(P)+)
VVYNENGINVEELHQYIVKNKGVRGHPDFQSDAESVFPFKSDVLVPAALEKAVHKGNADSI